MTVLIGRAHLETEIGNFEASATAAERALAVASEERDAGRQAAAVSALATIARLEGRFDDAEGYFEQILEIGRRIGDLEMECNALGNLGAVMHHKGDTGLEKMYPAAEPHYLAQLELSTRLGIHPLQMMCHANLAQLYLLTRAHRRAGRTSSRRCGSSSTNDVLNWVSA